MTNRCVKCDELLSLCCCVPTDTARAAAEAYAGLDPEDTPASFNKTCFIMRDAFLAGANHARAQTAGDEAKAHSMLIDKVRAEIGRRTLAEYAVEELVAALEKIAKHKCRSICDEISPNHFEIEEEIIARMALAKHRSGK